MDVNKKYQKIEKKITPLGKRLLILEKTFKLKPTELCKKLMISDGYLSNIKYGYVKKGNYDFWESIRTHYPEWLDYLKFNSDHPPDSMRYLQPEEKMLPEDKGGEMRPGSYGLPDLAGHQVTQVFEPELDMYLGMARTILTSGQPGTINALKSNLIAFNEQVKDKAQLRAMNENLDKLNKEIKTLKTIAGGCAETSADREAGNQ